MPRPLPLPRVLVALLVVAAAGPAQSRDALTAAVDDYLVEPDPARAAGKLERILGARLAPPRIVDIVRRRPPPFAPRFTLEVPHEGRRIRARVSVPPGHTNETKALPVSINIRLGRIPDAITVPGAINVSVPGYDPPRESDTGRDGFTKILRSVAWRANGRRDALWATGFSWAGHATFDIAMHRPGLLRGFIPMAGAPARRQFRLLPNLDGLRIYAFCGTGDDKELLWNLRELRRSARVAGFDYELLLDEAVPGRLYPAPRGVPRVRRFVHESPPRDVMTESGRVLADGPRVESPLLRIDAIDQRRVEIPDRIPVSASLSPDGKRRSTIRAMRDAVAWIDWKLKRTPGELLIRFRSKGVQEATLLIRHSLAAPGTILRIAGARGGTRRVPLAIDVRTLLEETRRLGDRHDPVVMRLPLRFRG